MNLSGIYFWGDYFVWRNLSLHRTRYGCFMRNLTAKDEGGNPLRLDTLSLTIIKKLTLV